MNKKMFQGIADKAAKYATEQLHENLQGIAQDIASDQALWLDKIMQDILPPRLYEAGRHGDLMEEIEAWMKSNKFKLVFIPDSLGIRVMRGDQVHAEFKTQLSMDSEPVQMVPTPLDGSQN